MSDRIQLLVEQVEQLVEGLEHSAGRDSSEASVLLTLQMLDFNVRTLRDLKSLEPEQVEAVLGQRETQLGRAWELLRAAEARAKSGGRGELDVTYLGVMERLAELLTP